MASRLALSRKNRAGDTCRAEHALYDLDRDPAPARPGGTSASRWEWRLLRTQGRVGINSLYVLASSILHNIHYTNQRGHVWRVPRAPVRTVAGLATREHASLSASLVVPKDLCTDGISFGARDDTVRRGCCLGHVGPGGNAKAETKGAAYQSSPRSS